MSKAYSADLRQRIVDAIDGGASRRQAARRFGVSVSSAIRYARRWRETGSVQAAAMGAPKGSKLDPHEDWLLTQIDAAPDLTLEEIIARLSSEKGVKSSIGGLWNFFHRHGISFKKKPRTQPSRNVLTSPRTGDCGARNSRRSTRPGWSSSTRPVPTPRWRAFAGGAGAASVWSPPCRMATGRR